MVVATLGGNSPPHPNTSNITGNKPWKHSSFGSSAKVFTQTKTQRTQTTSKEQFFTSSFSVTPAATAKNAVVLPVCRTGVCADYSGPYLHMCDAFPLECAVLSGKCSERPRCEDDIPMNGKCTKQHCMLLPSSSSESVAANDTISNDNNDTTTSQNVCVLDDCAKFTQEECALNPQCVSFSKTVVCQSAVNGTTSQGVVGGVIGGVIGGGAAIGGISMGMDSLSAGGASSFGSSSSASSSSSSTSSDSSTSVKGRGNSNSDINVDDTIDWNGHNGEGNNDVEGAKSKFEYVDGLSDSSSSFSEDELHRSDSDADIYDDNDDTSGSNSIDGDEKRRDDGDERKGEEEEDGRERKGKNENEKKKSHGCGRRERIGEHEKKGKGLRRKRNRKRRRKTKDEKKEDEERNKEFGSEIGEEKDNFNNNKKRGNKKNGIEKFVDRHQKKKLAKTTASIVVDQGLDLAVGVVGNAVVGFFT